MGQAGATMGCLKQALTYAVNSATCLSAIQSALFQSFLPTILGGIWIACIHYNAIGEDNGT